MRELRLLASPLDDGCREIVLVAYDMRCTSPLTTELVPASGPTRERVSIPMKPSLDVAEAFRDTGMVVHRDTGRRASHYVIGMGVAVWARYVTEQARSGGRNMLYPVRVLDPDRGPTNITWEDVPCILSTAVPAWYIEAVPVFDFAIGLRLLPGNVWAS